MAQWAVLTIGETCARLGTTARALRYREALGLLPVSRERGTHRRYGSADLEAARLSAALEASYGVPPAALAFALRAVTDPRIRADVERLAALTGRSPVAALDFESAKGRRLLARSLSPTPSPTPSRLPTSDPRTQLPSDG